MAAVSTVKKHQVAMAPLTRPGLVALLISAAFFAVFLGVLHPGYAINDDIKIIAIAAGYPDVSASPFLIFSNVLLGFLLVPLYKLPTDLNWEILLFLVVDMVSVCTLLYLVASASARRIFRVLGVVLVLTCVSYYPLKITFSSTAALACLAGFLAILAGTGKARESSRVLLALGGALIFTGSLIRIEMLALATPPVLAAALTLHRTIQWRPAVVALGCAGLLVFAGYAADRLYVRAHPDWNAYYFYNRTAQGIQDSHRLENMHLEIRRIGWSKNDQELFARYFFPDAGTYSLESLQYLAEHVSGISQNPVFVINSFLLRITSGRAGSALLVAASALLLMLAIARTNGPRLAIPLISAVALAENLGLMWIYKNPDYVLFSSVSNAAILATLMLFFPGVWKPDTRSPAGPRVMAFGGGLLVAALAVGASVWQSLLASSENLRNEIAYDRILADVEALRQDGTLAPNAVVVSASHGIPWNWSNPLLIGFPSFTYLDTGWNTFSPYYEEALRKHSLHPLMETLYEADHAYVIGKSILKTFLARYYKEHHGVGVGFETVYRVPDSQHVDGSEGIELFKVMQAPVTAP